MGHAAGPKFKAQMDLGTTVPYNIYYISYFIKILIFKFFLIVSLLSSTSQLLSIFFLRSRKKQKNKIKRIKMDYICITLNRLM